jgi:long-chain acyl-CoA synthetase
MLPAATQIRRFLVLNKEFDADDDEITRTRKIRRRFVAEKYAAVVEAFYADRDEVELSAEITYEDGRKAVMRSTLAVADVDEAEATPAVRPAPLAEPALSAAR